MTYENIYQKFMIEYDKAGITSSYPSLTEYEAATILDKAYLALIALKVSGNNLRRSTIDSDIKSVSDLQGLITSEVCTPNPTDIPNGESCDLESDFLYFVGATRLTDNTKGISSPIKLIPHESAEKFVQTEYNLPWIKMPVCYIEGGKMIILHDPNNPPISTGGDDVKITYIKRPSAFANANETLNNTETFDCNDSMAEELISLAVTFALENVESSRLNTKLNTRGLEA